VDVEQYITQRKSHLARSPQDAGVIAVGKEPTLALELPIDGKREANREALDASGECPAVVRFSDEMQVIPLHTEVHQREAELVLGGGQSLAHLHEQGVLAQRGHAAPYAQGDVEGVMSRVGRPTQVGDTRGSALWRSPGPLSDAAPGSKLKAELSM